MHPSALMWVNVYPSQPHVPSIRNPSDISNYDRFDEPDLQQWDMHNTRDKETFAFWDDMLGRA